VSEPHLVNVWIYPYMPNEWHCQTFEGITGIGKTLDEAKATFDRDWNHRAPYNLIDGHPPRPKRPDDPKPAAPSIEGETDAVKFHRLVLRAFHPDLHGSKKRWNATEIIAAINQAWTDSTGAK
jgi:hypothetical protein